MGRPTTMQSGTAKIGLLVQCPDGQGRISKILSSDVVLIESTEKKLPDGRPVMHKYDLSSCVALESIQSAENVIPSTLENDSGRVGSAA